MATTELQSPYELELRALEGAVGDWVRRGDPRPLTRWLERALDAQGIPVRLPVPSWPDCLSQLAEARRSRPSEWPEALDARVEGFVLGTLRFLRPAGRAVFGPERPIADRAKADFRAWATELSDPRLATVVNWWFPEPSSKPRRHAPPPLPAWSRSDRPLAALRADWSKPGGFVAVDHRDAAAPCAVELFALGRAWIGPTWSTEPENEAIGRSKPIRWVSQASADLLEWGFLQGKRKRIRTAAVFRGRQLALFADQVEGGDSAASMRLALSPSISPELHPEIRAATLTAGRSGPSIRVFPLGLPCSPYPSDRGSFSVDDGLMLRHRQDARRCWLPLLVSWNPHRNRRRTEWRQLTVSEKSKVSSPDTAFATRISWGRDESLVIYRSLARPALRAFLGHQTRARFLVALFNAKGDVEPLLSIDD